MLPEKQFVCQIVGRCWANCLQHMRLGFLHLFSCLAVQKMPKPSGCCYSCAERGNSDYNSAGQWPPATVASRFGLLCGRLLHKEMRKNLLLQVSSFAANSTRQCEEVVPPQCTNQSNHVQLPSFCSHKTLAALADLVIIIIIFILVTSLLACTPLLF